MLQLGLENLHKMAAEELRMARQMSIEKMKFLGRKLSDHIDTKKPRLILKVYNEIKDEFTKFETLHIQFCLKAEVSIDSEEEKQVFFDISALLDMLI